VIKIVSDFEHSDSLVLTKYIEIVTEIELILLKSFVIYIFIVFKFDKCF
jgi:hypothetical protein